MEGSVPRGESGHAVRVERLPVIGAGQYSIYAMHRRSFPGSDERDEG